MIVKHLRQVKGILDSNSNALNQPKLKVGPIIQNSS